MKSSNLVILLAMVMSASTAYAGPEENPSNGQMGSHPEGMPMRRPPPQAIEACQGKAEGTLCSFKGRDETTINGTCFASEAKPGNQTEPRRPPLACRPEQSEKKEHREDRRPPPN